jgi:hypothetical protein
VPDNHPCDLVSQCFPLKSPFRSMLLTLRGGPESLAPRAHRIPVYPMVFPHSYIVLSRRTVRTWQGWHHHIALSLVAVWFLIGETHRGQQLTPALTLPQVRYGLSLLLLEVFYTPGVDDICRQVQRQLLRNESARFYYHRTRKCMPPRKLHREIQ